MNNLSCKTCPFLADGTGSDECHNVRAITYNRFVDEKWWCSEHPLAPGQRERIAESIVLADITGLRAAKLEYDFGSLLRDAERNADMVLAKRILDSNE